MTDIEIARSVKPKKITQIAKELGVFAKNLILYGNYKAKINKPPKSTKQGKLVLVTAINPTKSGIGKTTVSIGLADAFKLKGERVCLALREPSLGPVFGIKGGATGGGYSQIIPMEDINLHFNGDFHAITSANNLLCSLIDNHIFQGNELNADPNTIMFHRCLDLNERSLREIECLNLPFERKDKFTITAASEIMAIMCVSKDLSDLKRRLGNIMVCLNKNGKPLYAKDFKAQDAMAILLKDALNPNLVQTLIGTPALVHLGPFANIAHGCNSIIATKMAMAYSDYCITEAGFGADLGAEKFLDFKCRIGDIKPNCVVLIATIKSLKLHGGVDEKELEQENLDAIKIGIKNLRHHINTIKNIYHLPLVVTLNKYSTDTKNEIELVQKLIGDDTKVILNDVWAKGGNGAKELCDEVIAKCNEDNSTFEYAYNLEDSVEKKILDIVQKIYGGKSITFSNEAKKALKNIERLKLTNLPIIMAKTQFSLTADKSIINAPKDFNIEIKDIEIRTGAGFLVVICGNMLLMPALSKNPSALNMKISANGKIEGLF